MMILIDSLAKDNLMEVHKRISEDTLSRYSTVPCFILLSKRFTRYSTVYSTKFFNERLSSVLQVTEEFTGEKMVK